jgi:hypothetical protein
MSPSITSKGVDVHLDLLALIKGMKVRLALFSVSHKTCG